MSRFTGPLTIIATGAVLGAAALAVALPSPASSAEAVPTAGVGQLSVMPMPVETCDLRRSHEAPEGILVQSWTTASSLSEGNRAALRGAIVDATGVRPWDVECWSPSEGDPFASTDDAEIADAGEYTPQAGDGLAEGHGWCRVDSIDDADADMALHTGAEAEFTRADQLADARAAVAEAAGAETEAIACEHFVPPVGECAADVVLAPDLLPDGAKVGGHVSISFPEGTPVDEIRAAVATASGADPTGVTCREFGHQS